MVQVEMVLRQVMVMLMADNDWRMLMIVKIMVLSVDSSAAYGDGCYERLLVLVVLLIMLILLAALIVGVSGVGWSWC